MRQFALERVIGYHAVPRRAYNSPCPLLRSCAPHPHWSPAVPSTFILPDLPWAVLLEPILHQAPSGATIIVYTAAMRKHVERAMRAADRDDLIVSQQDAPPAQSWS